MEVPGETSMEGTGEGTRGTQRQAVQCGARKGEAMALVASSLSEKDIDNLAAYFSSIEIRIGKLPGE